MTRKPPPIAAPIVIGKIWNFAIGPYEQHNLFSVREHIIGTDGIMRPTTRGVAMIARRLPEFAAAVQKALKKSRELGLIPDDERDVDSGGGTS